MNDQILASQQLSGGSPDNGAHCFDETRRLIIETGVGVLRLGNILDTNLSIVDDRTIRLRLGMGEVRDLVLLRDGSIAMHGPLTRGVSLG